MSQSTLLVASAISLGSGALYAYLGYRLGHRDVDPRVKTASLAFAAWWIALAANTILTAVFTLIAAFSTVDLGLFLAAQNLQMALISFALGALLYYLLFIFLGRIRFTWLIVAGYVVYFGVLTYWIQWSDPIGVKVGAWQVTLDTARPQEGPFFIVVVFLLIGPQFAAALAYFSLVFRVKERTQRIRVAIVSGSIMIWFGSSLLASAAGVAQSDIWQAVSRLLGILAPVAILFAFLPPAWAQRKFKIDSIAKE